MKHLGSIIKKQIETNKLIKKQIAEAVGISPNYLSGIFNQKSMDCELFEKICHVIGLDPSIAFDAPAPGSKTFSEISASTIIGPANVTIGETQVLKELLAEKERLIQVLLASSNLNIGTNTEHNL